VRKKEICIIILIIAVVGIPIIVIPKGDTFFLPSMPIQLSNQTFNTTDVEIQDIQVQPTKIKVDDIFTVNATLINNSKNLIIVDFSPRTDLYFVTFDSHVRLDTKQVGIEDSFVKRKVDPGEKITKVNSGSVLTFRANTAGTANATVTFVYYENNQLQHSKTISKSFSFTILDK
jgi:hypothetical protein